jgi:ABC-type lipoprotein export system ATPase subunit
MKISFNFEAGKSYAVVGASGCGKSTLLNLLLEGPTINTAVQFYTTVWNKGPSAANP